MVSVVLRPGGGVQEGVNTWSVRTSGTVEEARVGEGDAIVEGRSLEI